MPSSMAATLVQLAFLADIPRIPICDLSARGVDDKQHQHGLKCKRGPEVSGTGGQRVLVGWRAGGLEVPGGQCGSD